MAGQLAFDLRLRPAYGRDDFLVTPANEDAVAWIDRWPDWPAAGLVVTGPPGSGKSHLAEMWRAKSAAIRVDATRLADVPEPEPGSAQCVVIERVDEARDDAAVLHLFNRFAPTRGRLLFTARLAPGRWQGRLPDLATRLRALPTVAIGAPDDETIAAVLVKLFSDRQLAASEAVVVYLLSRIERSFEAARAVVEAIDAASLAGHRRVSVSLARAVLEMLDKGTRPG